MEAVLAIAIGVLLGAVVLESFSLRTAIREARPHLEGRGWVAFIRRAKNPELPVVLLEDSAALTDAVRDVAATAMREWRARALATGTADRRGDHTEHPAPDQHGPTGSGPPRRR